MAKNSYWLLLKSVFLNEVIEHDENRFLFCRFVSNGPGDIILLFELEQLIEAKSPSWTDPRLF